jgi:hypothetical protein
MTIKYNILICRWAEKLRNEDLYLFDLNHFHLLWDAEQADEMPSVELNPRLHSLTGDLRSKHLVIDAARQVTHDGYRMVCMCCCLVEPMA